MNDLFLHFPDPDPAMVFDPDPEDQSTGRFRFPNPQKTQAIQVKALIVRYLCLIYIIIKNGFYVFQEGLFFLIIYHGQWSSSIFLRA